MQQNLSLHLFRLYKVCDTKHLVPTRSEERGVLGIGSIPIAILPTCQDVKDIALQSHKHVKLGSKNKKQLRGSTQATIYPLSIILTAADV